MLQQLELEKELLGMYLSGHPMDPLQAKLDLLRLQSISEFPSLPERSTVRTAGMIADVRRIMTKKGEAMAFIQLQDRVSQVELVVFPRVWKQAEDLVSKGEVVVASGYIQHQEEQVKLIAERLVSPQELSAPTNKQKLFIKITEQHEDDVYLQRLNRLLKQKSMSGGLPVILYYEQKRQSVALSDAFRIRPSDELIKAIEDLTGPGTARVK